MLQFNVTFGVVPGYHHGNESVNGHKRVGLSARQLVEQMWRVAMEDERTATRHAIGAVLLESVTVYPVEFGCPEDGEVTVTAIGTKHPRELRTNESWKYAVLRVVESVRRRLNQSTAMVSFSEADVVYLTDQPEPVDVSH